MNQKLNDLRSKHRLISSAISEHFVFLSPPKDDRSVGQWGERAISERKIMRKCNENSSLSFDFTSSKKLLGQIYPEIANYFFQFAIYLYSEGEKLFDGDHFSFTWAQVPPSLLRSESETDVYRCLALSQFRSSAIYCILAHFLKYLNPRISSWTLSFTRKSRIEAKANREMFFWFYLFWRNFYWVQWIWVDKIGNPLHL